MKRLLISFDPEASDQAYALLVDKGVPAEFIRRGTDGDIIAVPANQARRVRRMLDDPNV